MSVVSRLRPIDTAVRGAAAAAAGPPPPGGGRRGAPLPDGGDRRGHLAQYLLAPRGADLHREGVAVSLEHLGQCEVEPERRLGPRVHRRAEAGAAGHAAIDRENEDAVALGAVVRIDTRPPDEGHV